MGNINIVVSGSREYSYPFNIQDFIWQLPLDVTVIHGGARGVDTWADEYAKQRGISVEVYPADWNKHGKSAGMIRNREMMKKADIVAVFWDGESKGTKNAIDLSKKLEIPCVLYRDTLVAIKTYDGKANPYSIVSLSVKFLRDLYGQQQGNLDIMLRRENGKVIKIARELPYPPFGFKLTQNSQLDRYNRSGYHVNYGVALRGDEMTDGNLYSGKSNCRILTTLWVDLDGVEGYHQAIEKVKKYNPNLEPHYVIQTSPKGYHVYWFIEPLTEEIDDNWNITERTLEGLALVSGADDSAVDISRRLRLPYTRNVKPKYESEGFYVKAIYERDDVKKGKIQRFKLDDFKGITQIGRPRVDKKRIYIVPRCFQPRIPKWVREYIEYGAMEGNRNNTLFNVACEYAGMGFPESQAESDLLPRYIADGGDEFGGKATIKSAYKRPRDSNSAFRQTYPSHVVDSLVNRSGE